jgi:hypothetical protein
LFHYCSVASGFIQMPAKVLGNRLNIIGKPPF